MSFNMGVETGQLLILAVSVPALNLLFRYVVAERMGTIIFFGVGRSHGMALADRARRLPPGFPLGTREARGMRMSDP